jgi:hypothetical protein
MGKIVSKNSERFVNLGTLRTDGTSGRLGTDAFFEFIPNILFVPNTPEPD